GNDNGGYTAPTLPPSVGTNPFKGKTFKPLYSDYENCRYVFSDDGETIMYYTYNNEIVPYRQYKYTVNADAKTLSWYTEKERGLSYEERIEEIKEQLKDYKTELQEENLSEKEIEERLKQAEEETIRLERLYFSRITTYSYEYNTSKGTLDLVEVFDENQAHYYYNGSSHDGLKISEARVSMSSNNGSGYIYIISNSSGFNFGIESFSKNKKEIVFVNDDDDNDTFTATYRLIGSGSDTKLILSFMRGEEQYELTLDFDPEKFHLTEAK
ncbi:MAG: hypothetical protein J1G30_09165, partial [Spirochaetales bacterium]|nr:hypothetical protein [Spirochaetales bacterium]